MKKIDDYINLTAPLHSATTKGKLGNANEIFTENDEDNVQNVINKTNEHIKKLDNRSSQMEESIKNISVTGGASVAEAVTYNNTTSGLESVNVKGAIDELQLSKADKSSVDKALAKKFDKESVSQDFGNAENKVISQKVITDWINKGYQFRGIATPDTNPGRPNGPVFYLASKTGNYVNFGGIELTDEVLIFTSSNGNWKKNNSGIATSEKINSLNLNINPLSNNKVFNSVIKEMYTTVDLSRVTEVQIAKANEYKGTYNNIIRFITDDRKYIVFYIHQAIHTQEEALAELKPFYKTNDNSSYCVIDWSKLDDGFNLSATKFVLNTERIQNLEFNPYIAGYIKGKELKADIQNIDKTNNRSVGSTSSLFKSGITNYQKPNTDIVNFIIYGQSLSTGQQTCPELSRENYKGNLMIGQYEWISGVGSNTKDSINLLKATSIKGNNYIPTGSLDQTNGETPNVNFANGAKCILDDYILNLVDRKILACSCGTGGQSIELLSKDCPNNNGGRFNQFIGALNTIKTLVDAENKTLSCGCVIWMQGEYNASAEKNQGWQSNTPATNNKDDYKAYLLGGKTSDNVIHNGLINDIIKSILTTYKQNTPPIILCSQIGPNFNKDFDNPIDMALLEANNESNLITLVAPSYCVTDRAGHLDPNGTRWLGEYYNKVWYNKVILGNNWKPLQPNKIIKGNNYLDIRFDVPVPPLKFDTHLVREKTNYGFSVKSNGINAIISNIDIISDDTVRITCNTDFEGDVEVAYATVGIVYGNLRDSDPWESFEKYKNLDKIVKNPEGVSYLPSWQPKDEKGNIIYDKKYPCYNWCMRFYYKLLSNKSELNINTGL